MKMLRALQDRPEAQEMHLTARSIASRAARPLGARRSGTCSGRRSPRPRHGCWIAPKGWTRLIPSARMELAPMRDVYRALGRISSEHRPDHAAGGRYLDARPIRR